MNEVRLEVETLDRFLSDVLEMADRLDGGDTAPAAAHLAFERMEDLLKVLTANRWRLLRRLRSKGPTSIRSLAKALERDYLHADVVALIDAGLVERDAAGRIAVPWTRITAEMAFDIAA
ncbi:MAG: HVO_A0114 family putative DNA-binding protein [Pararhizobium sp.]